MLRKRRLTVLLCMVLPLMLWSLAAWGQAGSSANPLANGQVRPADPDPVIQGIMDQVTREEFTSIDNGLSGETPITIGGQQVTLTTRYTPSTQGTLAEQYVYEYFQSLGYTPQYDPWSRCSTSGRNVIAVRCDAPAAANGGRRAGEVFLDVGLIDVRKAAIEPPAAARGG